MSGKKEGIERFHCQKHHYYPETCPQCELEAKIETIEVGQTWLSNSMEKPREVVITKIEGRCVNHEKGFMSLGYLAENYFLSKPVPITTPATQEPIEKEAE